MVNYQKLYAYLVGQIDLAITVLEKNGENGAAAAEELLRTALLTAEETYLKESE